MAARSEIGQIEDRMGDGISVHFDRGEEIGRIAQAAASDGAAGHVAVAFDAEDMGELRGFEDAEGH
jgi:hypothetical protein